MQFFHNPVLKWFELVLIFIGLPLLYFFELIPVHKSIPLITVFVLFLLILLTDKSFDRSRLGFNRFRDWKPILFRFLIFATVSILAVYVIMPRYLFILPRERTLLWLVIIVSYPIWSAFPQELIYRTWFFHRYRDLFGKEWVFLAGNAFLFSFSHIIFRNWVAIILTLAGGVMFAITYKKSKSLMAVFAEHVLYGDFIFTVGIGQFFYMELSG